MNRLTAAAVVFILSALALSGTETVTGKVKLSPSGGGKVMS